MILGLLSDSHGRAGMTGRAVAALRGRGADLLIHLGDVGTDAVLDELVGHPARVVFGNCDDARSLAAYAQLVDVGVDHPMGRLEVDGKHVAFTHGHIDSLLGEALADGVDYLLHGHSHTLRDDRVGPTRIINPGALFRAARYTAALLDLARDHLEVLEVGPE